MVRLPFVVNFDICSAFVCCNLPTTTARVKCFKYQNINAIRLLFFSLIYKDHDYGCNNADSTYEFSRESGISFVEFLGLPKSSAMSARARQGLGVYGVKVFDFSRPRGQEGLSDLEARIDPDMDGVFDDVPTGLPSYSMNHSVAVFVLDVRTNKSPWKKGKEAYRPDYEGDFLGEAQWQWFETAIRRSRAAVNVIVNGLQVHSNLYPDPNVAEAWGKFPTSQQRLYNIVLQEGIKAPILISGDVHMTQFMRKDCISNQDDPVVRRKQRALIEMTTSGM
jgi:hypothetical protein